MFKCPCKELWFYLWHREIMCLGYFHSADDSYCVLTEEQRNTNTNNTKCKFAIALSGWRVRCMTTLVPTREARQNSFFFVFFPEFFLSIFRSSFVLNY